MRWLEFLVVSGVFLLLLAGYYVVSQPTGYQPPLGGARDWLGAIMLAAAYGYYFAQAAWVRSVSWLTALLWPLLSFGLVIVLAAAYALFTRSAAAAGQSDGAFMALYSLLNVGLSAYNAARRAQVEED